MLPQIKKKTRKYAKHSQHNDERIFVIIKPKINVIYGFMRRAALWKILLIIHFPLFNFSTDAAATNIIAVRSILVSCACIDVYLMG